MSGALLGAAAVEGGCRLPCVAHKQVWGIHAAPTRSLPRSPAHTDGTLLVASKQPSKDSSSSAASQPPASDGGGATEAAAPPPPPAPAAWRVAQTLRQFGEGRIKQLAVARERSMLLCLADDGVNAYVLPALRLKGQAARTRGASLFAWHAASDTLAVAVKRR